MKETIDDRRYRMQMEEKARREGMEAESKRKNEEYNAALESGDVSPEVEAELTRSQAEKAMDLVLRLVCLWTNPYCPIRIVPGEGEKRD